MSNNLSSKKRYNKKEEISIKQPIFRSGGIWYGVKYANALEDYRLISNNIQKNNLLKKAYGSLFNIKKINLQIKQQKLLIKNSSLEVSRKKEQSLNGLIDTISLNKAIIELNNKKSRLVELKYFLQKNINNFKQISSKDYKSVKLPKLKFISFDTIIKDNLAIKQYKSDIKVKKDSAVSSSSIYFPQVNLLYSYTQYHDPLPNTPKNEKFYGFNIVVPLDWTIYQGVYENRIKYLKAKINLTDKINEQKQLIKTQLSQYDMLNKKIKLLKNDIRFYAKMIKHTNKLVKAGIGTKTDKQILQNSKKINQILLDIYKVDKQLVLLELYSMTDSE